MQSPNLLTMDIQVRFPNFPKRKSLGFRNQQPFNPSSFHVQQKQALQRENTTNEDGFDAYVGTMP